MAELSEHSKRAWRILQGKSMKEVYEEFPHKKEVAKKMPKQNKIDKAIGKHRFSPL